MEKTRMHYSIRSLLVFTLAAALVAGVSIHAALAYFTTYCMAEGGLPIEYGTRTVITEEPQVVEGKKVVSIKNSADSKEAIYVRVRAFAGEEFQPLHYSGEGWTDGNDGFWYYDGILEPGQDTDAHKLTIQVDGLLTTDGYAAGDKIEVPVIYESMPVQYDENWNQLTALQANWNKLPQTESNTEGGE